jgi:hypothetical protein
MVQSSPITPAELRLARSRLSLFVQSEATATANELGFGWRAAPIAPSGLDGLTEEFRSCYRSGLPFRVLQDFSEDTIFNSASTDWAMRFWHDSRHVWLGADFSTEGELQVASCHLARARAQGFGRGSLEYALLLADTVGQTLYLARTKSFVVQQRPFAIDCVCFDFDTAVEKEIQRSLFEGSAS